MNNTLSSALRKVSRNLSVDRSLVESVYKSYWRFIKETISENRLSEMTEEEFDSLSINFNIPRLGKLFVEYEKIEKYRRHIKYLQNVKDKENKADRLTSAGD